MKFPAALALSACVAPATAQRSDAIEVQSTRVMFQAALESASAVAITGNQLTFASAPAYSGIYERSVLSAPITGVIVANNLISGPLTYGVQLHASPGQFGAGVLVRDNLAPGATFPLYLNNPAGFTEPPQ